MSSMITVTLDVFPLASLPSDSLTQSLKVLEEASEVRSAAISLRIAREADEDTGEVGEETISARAKLADELADCMQACVNLARIEGLDMRAAVSRVHEKNLKRGRIGY